jgi:hypothetical protein
MLFLATTAIEQLVASAHFGRRVQEQLFGLFCAHAFPSDYLGLGRFAPFLASIFTPARMRLDQFRRYFYAFDVQQKQMLAFNDVLLGW